MANRDNPSGFTPIGTINGSNYSTRRFKLSGSANRIFVGDAFRLTADGVAHASASQRAAGVSLEDAAASATGDILGVPVEGVIFRVQSTGNTVEADIGQLADSTATTGDTATGRSNQELDFADQGTSDSALRIIDKDDRPDNAWGTNVDLLVMFYEHEFTTADEATPGV